MRSMSLERKQYLIHQSRQSKSVLGTPSQTSHQASSQGFNGASSVTLISPQYTGGIMKRLSLWGASTSSPSTSTSPAQATTGSPGKETSTEALPIVPQITGSLWGNWWSSSPRETEKPKEGDRSTPKSAEWFVDGIRNGKATDSRLVKHLISLRVHLSTAKVAWVEKFLEREKGMNALADLLGLLVEKSGRR